MISSTAYAIISKTDNLPICLPIISHKRFRLLDKWPDATHWNMFWITPYVAVTWLPGVTCQLSRSTRRAHGMAKPLLQPRLPNLSWQGVSKHYPQTHANVLLNVQCKETHWKMTVDLFLKIYPPTIRLLDYLVNYHLLLKMYLLITLPLMLVFTWWLVTSNIWSS